jgi:hypothetical protein
MQAALDRSVTAAGVPSGSEVEGVLYFVSKTLAAASTAAFQGMDVAVSVAPTDAVSSDAEL